MSGELIKELRHIKRDGTWTAKQPDAPHPVCVKAADRITALIAAGDKLAGFAGHDDGYQVSCDLLEKPCNCGYGEAWKAWHNLTGKAEQ